MDLILAILRLGLDAVEVAEDGEDAAVVAFAGGESEFGENVIYVLFDRAAADDEGGGDGGVGAALGHQREDLALPGGELAERVAAAGEQLGDDLGVEGAAALGHPGQRVEELGDVGAPVLEQVADAAGAAGDELGRVLLLDPLGEHQHADVGPAVADHERGPQALIGEGGRHPHVDHGRVGRAGGDRAQEPLGVGLGRDDLVPGLLEEPGQPLAEQHRVLGDRYPHGSTAEIIVGPPDGDSTDSSPSTPLTRSARPDRPAPGGAAPPMPSSLTSTVSVPGKPWPSTTTLTWLARECLATLVSASATMKYATASTAGFGLTGTSTCTSTGTGQSAARPDSAGSRPRSVRIGGCTPRTRFRSSVSAAFASACARSTRSLAASGSSPNF